jgi:hypothetical protein
MLKQSKKGRVKKVILTFAIAILFVLFIVYAVGTIYPGPKYEDYCPATKINPLNQTYCEAVNGTWTTYPTYASEKSGPAEANGYCDTYSKCQKSWDDSREKYNRNLFFISLITGLIILVASFILRVESVSAGFMLGSVILIIYGTIRFWGNLSNILRTLMLGLALAVLVWIGYRKLR